MATPQGDIIDFIDESQGDTIDFIDESQPKEASTLAEDFQAGLQSSSGGLAVRGKMPDLVLGAEHSKWYDKLAASAGQIVGDLPAMAIGGLAGAVEGLPGGAVGAAAVGAAGAFALPAAVRQSYVEAYSKGEVKGWADFLDRTSIVMKETGKAAAIGAATGGVGGAVTKVASPMMSPLATTATRIGAEAGTLTVAPALLEGHAPDPEDALNAAILMVGMKGAGKVSNKLMNLWAKTGVRPEQAVADAIKDPSIAADLNAGVALSVAQESNTFKGQHPAAGRNVGFTQPPDTPVEKLFANFADTKNDQTTERQSQFRSDVFDRANSFSAPVKTVSTESVPFGNDQLVISASTTGESRFQVLRNGEVIAAAKTDKGMVDSIAVSEGYKGQQLGEQLLRWMHDNKVANIYEVPDRSPGFVKIQKKVISDLAAEAQQPKGEAVQTDLFGNDVYFRDPDVPDAYRDMAAKQAAMDAVSTERAKPFAESPFATDYEPFSPTQINLKYTNSEADADATMARLSEVYVEQIQSQRRGTVSWDQTRQDAATILKGLADDPRQMDDFLNRKAGTPAGDAEILARKDLAIAAAERLSQLSKDYLAAGGDAAASPIARMQYYADVELAQQNMATFLGARAEPARAMNALKITSEAANRAKALQDALDTYSLSPEEMAKRIVELDTPEGVKKFTKEALKATTWEQMVEAWKAGLVSRPTTQVANVMGNLMFSALRVPVDLTASAIGSVRGNADRVGVVDTLAASLGGIMGTIDGLKAGTAIVRYGVVIDPKLDVHRKAIPGKVGEAVRMPFRFLSAADAVFRISNERYTIWQEASREAIAEGHNPLTAEYRTRVAEIANNPSPELLKQAQDDAVRYTFTAPLGSKGRAVQNLVKEFKLEWAIPFIATPGNVFKELARLTPAAPIVKEWRDQFAKGGEAADKAVAELAVGAALGTLAMSYAFSDQVSGAGDPDPNKKRVQLAAGWQPYSVKIGDKWVSYQRLQPVGTLVGAAADVANLWEHFTPEESDKVPKMLSVAFANAVTNQTFLQGMTNVVNALSEPQRFGPRLMQNLAASTVPGIISETASMQDPYVREINSVMDAVKNRIPGLRDDLLPGRDVFGDQIANKERIGGITPLTVKGVSKDKVRSEAARLGVAVAKAPDSVTLPAAGDKRIGKVALTPEQQDVFADVSGKLAHEQLSRLVNSYFWDEKPDFVKRLYYTKIFEKAREVGAAKALSAQDRAREMRRIADEIQRELAKPPAN